MKLKFTTITLLLFGAINSFSQNYFLKNYGLKEGLSHNSLFDVLQAQDNSLWITSFHGLMQFDGKKFKTYTTDDGLCSNQIRNIFEDSKGRIWVGAWRYDGISIIDNGEVYTPTDSVLKVREVMNAAYEDSLGVVWLFGTKGIVKCVDDQFITVYSEGDDDQFLVPNGVAELNKNQLIIPLIKGGLAKMTLYPFSIQYINDQSHGINNTCYSIYKDKDEVMWVGHYGGFFSYKNGKIKKYTLPGDPNQNRVWSIDEDKDGYFWMALYGGGFVRWNKKEEFVLVNEENGLIDPYCYKLLIDNENNKWIVTSQGGLVQFRDFSFKYYKKEHGLPSNIISNVVEHENEIVCSSDWGLIFLENDSLKEAAILGTSINAIAYDDENTLWLATNQGYGSYKNGALKLFNTDEIFYALDVSDKIIFAGHNQVIIDNELVVERSDFNIKTVEAFEDQQIIGAAGGASDFINGERIRDAILSPIEFNMVYSSLKISDNEFLLGNPNEMVYYKKTGEESIVKRYPRKRFGDIKGFKAFFKKGDDLWIASDNSLSKLNLKILLEKDSVFITTIDQSNGYIDGEASPNGLLIDGEGVAWVATFNGLMKYSEDLTEVNKNPPKLKMGEVKLFSELFEDSLYAKKGELEFSYDKNHFTFNYSGISLTNPEKIRYKYRLVGLQNNWSEETTENKVVYSYLPPGKYWFEFIASNGSGYWEKTPASYQFEILPPFWETIWFRLLVVLSVLMLLVIIFYRYKKKVQAKQLELEMFTRNILQGQEEERKRVSKELHDGIGQKLLLINNAVIQEKHKELPGLVDSTIDDVRSISRNLHPFQLERFGITLALETMVKDIEASGSEIFFSEEIENIDDLLTKENEINLYRIFQECINNIFKHSKATSAKLTVEKRKDALYVEIRDNGVGFSQSKGENKLNSLGLKSIQERVKILNGEIKFKSEKDKGTEIVIYIHL